jgi:poly-gamma-glutamate capsule biosynthesis protein CapA/YwtB (metallophosphatase superfamily)
MDDYIVKTPLRQRKPKPKRKPSYVGGVAVIVGFIVLVVALIAFVDFDKEKPKPIVTVASPKPTVAAKPSPKASPKATPSDVSTKVVTLSFVGDVIFAGHVQERLEQQGYDYPYKPVQAYLDADIQVANMETPVTTIGTQQFKEYTYQSTPKALPAFRSAGFDVVTLANNHSMDYGVAGLLDTMQNLTNNGIKYTGAGRTADEAYAPVVVKRKGVKVAFVGLSHVVPNASWKAQNKSTTNPNGVTGVAHLYDMQAALNAVKRAKQVADIVIVMPHWGVERVMTPNATQTEMAHALIDAGADLIVGSHPHVAQAIEQYKGKWIAYSLGNFLFTTSVHASTWKSIVLDATCSQAAGCSLAIKPIANDMQQPRPMAAADAAAYLTELQTISHGIQIDANGRVTGVK